MGRAAPDPTLELDLPLVPWMGFTGLIPGQVPHVPLPAVWTDTGERTLGQDGRWDTY